MNTIPIVPFWPEDKAPATLGLRVLDELLSRADYMPYKSGNVHGLHYAEACAALGAIRLAAHLRDDARLKMLADRYRPEKLPPNSANHVDVSVTGIIDLALYRELKNPELLKGGLGYADGQWAEVREDGLSGQTRFWIDDVWMIGILQTEAWRSTGKVLYLDRTARELAAYVEKLQQPSGLFFHGFDGHQYWGRGNGWVAAGLAEILSVLPRENPYHGTLSAGYLKMMKALLGYQSPRGLWRQLVDHEEAWEETSCTAMFGYAFTLGVRNGLLPQAEYLEPLQKAWLALAEYVEADGRLRDICPGTGQSEDIQFYLGRPRVTGDLHGQAPLLWFAEALL